MEARTLVGAGLAAVLSFVAGCQRNTELKGEAGRISHAVDELRRAPNAAKAPFLERLRQERCSAPETCGLQSACLASYELHLRALDAIAESKRLVADGGAELGVKVLEAGQLLDRAQGLTKKCADAQGEIVRQFGL